MGIYYGLGGVEVTESVHRVCWEQCGCCPPGLGGGSCRTSLQLTHSRAVLQMGTSDCGWVVCLGMLVFPSPE